MNVNVNRYAPENRYLIEIIYSVKLNSVRVRAPEYVFEDTDSAESVIRNFICSQGFGGLRVDEMLDAIGRAMLGFPLRDEAGDWYPDFTFEHRFDDDWRFDHE